MSVENPLPVNDLSHRYLWGAAMDQILADEQLSPRRAPIEDWSGEGWVRAC